MRSIRSHQNQSYNYITFSGKSRLLTCKGLHGIIFFTLVTHVFRQRPGVHFVFPKWLFAIPLVFGLLGAVFSGWLADAKLGNYRVMKYSFVLLFLISLLSSAFTLVPGIAHYVYVVSVLYCIGGSISIVAVVACSVTSLQLGLDQMPDASSSNITSFIAWFAFSIYAGVWISYGSGKVEIRWTIHYRAS